MMRPTAFLKLTYMTLTKLYYTILAAITGRKIDMWGLSYKAPYTYIPTYLDERKDMSHIKRRTPVRTAEFYKPRKRLTSEAKMRKRKIERNMGWVGAKFYEIEKAKHPGYQALLADENSYEWVVYNPQKEQK